MWPALKIYSRGRGRLEGDLVPQRFEAFDELPCQPLWLQAVQEVRAQVLVRRPPL